MEYDFLDILQPCRGLAKLCINHCKITPFEMERANSQEQNLRSTIFPMMERIIKGNQTSETFDFIDLTSRESWNKIRSLLPELKIECKNQNFDLIWKEELYDKWDTAGILGYRWYITVIKRDGSKELACSSDKSKDMDVSTYGCITG